MAQLSDEVKEIFVVKMLSIWEGSKLTTVSLEAGVYVEFFSFLTPIHTFHDKTTGDPIILAFNREESIDQIKKKYNFKTISEFHGSQLHRDS